MLPGSLLPPFLRREPGDEASLASQTHFRKRGKGLVNCVYKPCPGALYSAPQSRCSILSHGTLHHCFSSNSSLENSKRELHVGHLSRYYRNCKNTLRIVFRERAYPATGNLRVHYLKSGYVIQLIAFRWKYAVILQCLSFAYAITANGV